MAGISWSIIAITCVRHCESRSRLQLEQCRSFLIPHMNMQRKFTNFFICFCFCFSYFSSQLERKKTVSGIYVHVSFFPSHILSRALLLHGETHNSLNRREDGGDINTVVISWQKKVRLKFPVFIIQCRFFFKIGELCWVVRWRISIRTDVLLFCTQ